MLFDLIKFNFLNIKTDLTSTLPLFSIERYDIECVHCLLFTFQISQARTTHKKLLVNLGLFHFSNRMLYARNSW